MKNLRTLHSFFYFVCLFGLSAFFGCGDAEEAAESPFRIATVSSPEEEAIVVPRDWYLTENTALYLTYYRAVLLKRFGDIPQVHIVVDGERKLRRGLSQAHDEFIGYLEALYHLFPREATLRSLEHHRKLRAEGGQVNIISVNARDEVVIKQLMEQRGLTRGEAKAELKKIRAEQKRRQEGEVDEEDEGDEDA